MNFGVPPGKRPELAERAVDVIITSHCYKGKKNELGVQTVFEPKLEHSFSDFYPETRI